MTKKRKTQQKDCPFNEKVLMQSICGSISEGVLAVDLDLRVIFFNPAAERITGVKTRDAIGNLYQDVIHEESCQTLCSIRKTLENRRPVANHSTHLVKKGGERVLEGVFSFHDIVGKSPVMKKIFSILPSMARSEATVLILGESGTGKELVARAIHHESLRGEGPLVTLNCGALPDMLLESELFGYRAGAFTDARTDKPGQVAMAEKGTLFLDEIGEMSAAVQVKLLRLLQEKTYHPLGAVKPVAADVRFVAATNRVLENAVKEGHFREDLFYRLNVLSLKLPPLREREIDIPLLVDHMIARHNRIKDRRIEGITPEALQVLMKHSFPGNVRELENVLEHAFALGMEGLIDIPHLPPALLDGASRSPARIPRNMQDLESVFILNALEENSWNRQATADALGIHPSTLYRKIRALKVKTARKDGRTSAKK